MADEVVDWSHGKRLSELCKEKYEPLWIKGGSHCNLELYPEYIRHLNKFITAMEKSLSNGSKSAGFSGDADAPWTSSDGLNLPRKSTDQREKSRQSTDNREKPRHSTDRRDKSRVCTDWKEKSKKSTDHSDKARTSMDQPEKPRKSFDRSDKT